MLRRGPVKAPMPDTKTHTLICRCTYDEWSAVVHAARVYGRRSASEYMRLAVRDRLAADAGRVAPDVRLEEIELAAAALDAKVDAALKLLEDVARAVDELREGGPEWRRL